MMNLSESRSLSATMNAWKPAGLCANLVDHATALELRRATTRAVRDKRRARTPVPMDFSCPPTIRTLDTPASAPARVPVVIVGKSPAVRAPASGVAIKLDLSWLVAAFVALSTTLAFAIPLEIFRQHG